MLLRKEALNPISQGGALICGLIMVLIGAGAYLKNRRDGGSTSIDDDPMPFLICLGGFILIAFGVGGPLFIHQLAN